MRDEHRDARSMGCYASNDLLRSRTANCPGSVALRCQPSALE
jgi:hypothetical protein